MEIRLATRDDVPAIVALLADDEHGAGREDASLPLARDYLIAFEAIDGDPNHDLVVVTEDDTGDVVATAQLSFLPNLTYRGGWRAQVEGVRVAARVRGSGVGRELMAWVIDRATARECRLVQLTTNATREDAKRFYESLGFEASHHGMKLHLPEDPDAG